MSDIYFLRRMSKIHCTSNISLKGKHVDESIVIPYLEKSNGTQLYLTCFFIFFLKKSKILLKMGRKWEMSCHIPCLSTNHFGPYLIFLLSFFSFSSTHMHTHTHTQTQIHTHSQAKYTYLRVWSNYCITYPLPKMFIQTSYYKMAQLLVHRKNSSSSCRIDENRFALYLNIGLIS